MSKGYYASSTAAAYRALMAQAAAQAREMVLLKKTQDAESRMKLAQDAYDRGDIKVAARIYMRLSVSRPPNEVNDKAKDRLKTLADDAYAKQAKIDDTLSARDMKFSLSELYEDHSDGETDPRIADWQKTICQAFKDYNELVEDYEVLPAVSKKLKSNIKTQRRRPEIAVVLNEPEAKTLYEAGQQHESDGHACCAYWAYRQAAQLAPAPSARKAQTLVDTMEKDPETMAAARTCRELQHCHQLYANAERLLTDKPDRARELFTEIIDRSPSDSEIHRAAKQQLAGLIK
jgi:hypothetical protein